MVLSLSYRRPAYVARPPSVGSQDSDNSLLKGGDSIRSGSSRTSGIPPALSFDRIIANETCPPLTLRDFMNYLLMVEHSAENLQLFMWYRDYTKRFAEAKASDTDLAPEWTEAMEIAAVAKIKKDAFEKARPSPQGPAGEMFKGTYFDRHDAPTTEISNPLGSPPPTASERTAQYAVSNATSYRTQAGEAFSALGKQPFTIQPFRDEINRVISTYIMIDSPRQLNLSDRERKATVYALAYTTHPSALRLIAKQAETTLRNQAHPNFVRWSIGNGNPVRVRFARVLGAFLILAALALALVLTLSRARRGWRALAAIPWAIGAASLMAASKGMCVVLQGMHHRHVRPWEHFVDDTDDDDNDAEKQQQQQRQQQTEAGNDDLSRISFQSFGSSNSYEDDPRLVRYKKRSILRKVFDRERLVEEPALRQIQDTIFLQCILAALLGAGFLTAIFVSVPAGNFY